MQTSLRTLPAVLAVALLGAVTLGLPARAADSTSSPAPSASSAAGTRTPVASTANNLTFGIGPAVQVPNDHYVDGRPYISVESAAGGVTRDAVALINAARKPVTVTVYPADAAQNGTPNFQLSLINQPTHAAGRWFTLEGRTKLRITIPASHAAPDGTNVVGRVVVPFEARVPLGTAPGDHAAAIVAELDALGKKADGAAITLQQRIGVAVYFHLAGHYRSALKLSNVKATWSEPGNALGTGTYTVSFTVTNVGDLRLNASTLVNTDRWFLSPIRSYPGSLTNLFPGGRVNVTETVRGVFGFGPWHGKVSAFATAADPTLGVTTAPVSQTVSLWPVPWILIAIIVGVLVVLYVSWRLYRRWRKRREAERERLEQERIAKEKAEAKAAREAAIAERQAQRRRGIGRRSTSAPVPPAVADEPVSIPDESSSHAGDKRPGFLDRLTGRKQGSRTPGRRKAPKGVAPDPQGGEA